MLKGTGKAYRRSKQLRREMTLPEIMLWQQLRGNRSAHKWRRQHPAGAYILDFYCDAAKLCVEVDGEAHGRGDAPLHDARRDAWLADNGIFTLRVTAADVLGNLDGILAHIAVHARRRAPLHQPLAGPPPPDKLGEDI